MGSTCLCRTLRDLSEDFDEDKATQLASSLNSHLETIRKLLAKSKSLTRDVHWQLIPSNQRTRKILSVKSIDKSRLNLIYQKFNTASHAFWQSTNDFPHMEIRRRIACVVVFLRSELDREAWTSPDITALFKGSKTSELRFAGKKYVKIARKLGGIGSLFWLPLEVPSSTYVLCSNQDVHPNMHRYERYLIMDDDASFDHLKSVASDMPNYDEVVQRLILSQLKGIHAR